jgi:hypothetical protein
MFHDSIHRTHVFRAGDFFVNIVLSVIFHSDESPVPNSCNKCISPKLYNLFKSKSTKEPTETEIVQLELQRNIGVENLSSYELMLINEIRTKDVAIEKVSKMLKEKLKAPDRCFLFPCPSSFPCLFKLTSFT